MRASVLRIRLNSDVREQRIPFRKLLRGKGGRLVLADSLQLPGILTRHQAGGVGFRDALGGVGRALAQPLRHGKHPLRVFAVRGVEDAEGFINGRTQRAGNFVRPALLLQFCSRS